MNYTLEDNVNLFVNLCNVYLDIIDPDGTVEECEEFAGKVMDQVLKVDENE